MRILILGGRGFLGSNMAKALASERGVEIFAHSRVDGLDLQNLECVRGFFRDIQPDFIINCAAHVGGVHYVSAIQAKVLFDNLQMSLNMFEAAKSECPKATIVNPLSNCCYPGNTGVFFEKNWWEGDIHSSVYPYGHAKRMIFVMSTCYAKQHGIRTINLLVPNAFGPGDHTDPNRVHALNGMIIRMLEAAQRGERKFEIWGSGKPIREWIYVDDVTSILKRALSMGGDFLYPVNLARNKGYSILETAQLIAEAVGFKGEITLRPEMQDGDPMKVMDDGEFRKRFPDFKFTDFREGIRRTVEYYSSVSIQKAA